MILLLRLLRGLLELLLHLLLLGLLCAKLLLEVGRGVLLGLLLGLLFLRELSKRLLEGVLAHLVAHLAPAPLATAEATDKRAASTTEGCPEVPVAVKGTNDTPEQRAARCSRESSTNTTGDATHVLDGLLLVRGEALKVAPLLRLEISRRLLPADVHLLAERLAGFAPEVLTKGSGRDLRKHLALARLADSSATRTAEKTTRQFAVQLTTRAFVRLRPSREVALGTHVRLLDVISDSRCLLCGQLGVGPVDQTLPFPATRSRPTVVAGNAPKPCAEHTPKQCARRAVQVAERRPRKTAQKTDANSAAGATAVFPILDELFLDLADLIGIPASTADLARHLLGQTVTTSLSPDTVVVVMPGVVVVRDLLHHGGRGADGRGLSLVREELPQLVEVLLLAGHVLLDLELGRVLAAHRVQDLPLRRALLLDPDHRLDDVDRIGRGRRRGDVGKVNRPTENGHAPEEEVGVLLLLFGVALELLGDRVMGEVTKRVRVDHVREHRLELVLDHLREELENLFDGRCELPFELPRRVGRSVARGHLQLGEGCGGLTEGNLTQDVLFEAVHVDHSST